MKEGAGTGDGNRIEFFSAPGGCTFSLLVRGLEIVVAYRAPKEDFCWTSAAETVVQAPWAPGLAETVTLKITTTGRYPGGFDQYFPPEKPDPDAPKA